MSVFQKIRLFVNAYHAQHKLFNVLCVALGLSLCMLGNFVYVCCRPAVVVVNFRIDLFQNILSGIP